MKKDRGEPLLDRFALHYGIDVSTFPTGNFSWKMDPVVGEELTDLNDRIPPFSHTGSAARGHWQTTFVFKEGEETVRVVANSTVVVVQITGRTVPTTLVTGAEGQPLTIMVSHPIFEGLEIDEIDLSDDLCSIVCLRKPLQ